MKPLVIYHGNCADGFTAAWLFNRFWHERTTGRSTTPKEWVVDHHAAVYGEAPPEVKPDQDVYILDFSYLPEQLKDMLKGDNRITVIDHHESAIRKLESFDYPRIDLRLDTSRSGAYLTSLFCWPGREPSRMVKLVDDRDRWVFADPRSRNFAAGLFSRPYSIGEWNRASNNVQTTCNEGEAIERKHQKDIDELLGQTATVIGWEGVDVALANMSYMHASDAGHKLLEAFPDVAFAATYYIKGNGQYSFSLRSDDTRMNVALLAERFGGGGHRNASGFRWPTNPFTA